jgi:arylsulfatase A-like enzyme
MNLIRLCLLCVLLAPQQSARADERPNILFLFADDLSYEGVAALGYDATVLTPNLDSLARRGTSFDHCYQMGSWSGAVCIASRMMLNSGRTVWRAEALHAQAEQERQAGRWWSEHLRRSGYRTYFTGKWHNPANVDLAFDVVRHVRPAMPGDGPSAYGRPPESGADPWSPTDTSLGGYWEGGVHWSEVSANDAIDFLDEAAVRDEPSFLYVAFNSPHDPRQSPQEFLDRYPLESIPLPENYLPEYPFRDAIGCGPDLRDEALAPFPRTEHAVRVHRREYYAAISHLDAQIGRILEHLASSPAAANTWVFFTADHGLAVGHHGLLGKQNLYDHSVRVPFLVAGPGVAVGRRIAEPICLQDVVPTTLALAGVAQPDHIEFQNLLPLLEGTGESRHRSVYGAYLNRQRMVLRDGWKLMVYPQVPIVRLYDVAHDPHETQDVADDPEHSELVRSLFGELQRLQAEQGDELDLTQAFPDLADGG